MRKSCVRKQTQELDATGVHVTFKEHKRIMPFNNDDQVDGLRHQFLRVFSDVLGGQVAPAEVMFQRYHSGFHDFVDISDKGKLQEGDKVQAIVRNSHKDKEASGVKCRPCPRGWFRYCAHVCIRFDACKSCETAGDPYKEHPIVNDTTYRLWNPLSKLNGALIQRDPTTNVVSCNGNFEDVEAAINTVVKSQSVIKPGEGPTFAFIFTDAGGDQYGMKAMGKDTDIIAEKISGNGDLPSDFIFEPDYYWSYTMLKSLAFNNLYLGCNADGKATLVDIGSPSYPNPQTLFVVNKVVLDS